MVRTPRRRFAAAVGAAALGMAVIAIATPPAQAASATTATLIVQKGGDRTGAQSVSGLGGATFDFIAGTANNPPGSGATVAATCTTATPSGQCSVNLPGRTGGGGNPLGYWIREDSTAPGYTVPLTLDTGVGSNTTPKTYNLLFTGNVANNTTTTFPRAETGNTNLAARGGVWADIRDNPDIPTKCGLNLALLLDTSGSVAPFLSQLKAAADDFIDALTGTASQVALYRFASTSSALLPPTPVSSAASATTIKTAIAGLTATGATNWDQGLFQIAAAPTPFDAVIMITDGNPTVYGPRPDGPGDRTRFREVENGIFSANALKALGTKIVAVGVGAGVTGATQNLEAISGTVRGTDFTQTDYPALAGVFRTIALRTCAGTVSVVKEVIPSGGGTPVPTAGWTFGATSNPTGVTPASAVTGNTGAVTFTAPLTTATSADVTVTETQQTGFSLVQQGGFNASCLSNGGPVPVTDAGALGFTVTADINSIVTCMVLNQATTAAPAEVQVNKLWTINGEDFPDPTQPASFQAALSLTGQPTPAFGTIFTGYSAGDDVTVGESVSTDLLPPGCTNVASGDIGSHTLHEGLNVFQIHNVVTCVTTLRLLKNVINPFGPPAPVTDWTLSALVPGPLTPIVTGTSGVSGVVTAGVTYPLAETSVPGYKQEVLATAVLVTGSTGSWHCVLRLRGGGTGQEFDGLNGAVTVQLGQNAECTANNTAQPAEITLVKTVINTHGGTATPTDWTLTAKPDSPNPEAVTITGKSGGKAVTGAFAVPEAPYTLTESAGPTGYKSSGPAVCVLTGTTTAVPAPGGVVTPGLGQHITCTFTNHDTATPPLPPTGVDFAPAAGVGGLLVLSGIGLLVTGRRRSRG